RPAAPAAPAAAAQPARRPGGARLRDRRRGPPGRPRAARPGGCHRPGPLPRPARPGHPPARRPPRPRPPAPAPRPAYPGPAPGGRRPAHVPRDRAGPPALAPSHALPAPAPPRRAVPPAPVHRHLRAALLRAGTPLVAGALVADLALAPLLRHTPFANGHRI